MNSIQIQGLFINLIIYFIMILPIIIISIFPKSCENKRNLIISIIISIIIESFISFLIYTFPNNIFKLFSKTQGVINYAVYAFKILFIPSSLFGFKILVPKYLVNGHLEKRKIAILISSKIAITTIFIILGYFIFNTKGILFAIPLADLIYIFIYIYTLLYIIR